MAEPGKAPLIVNTEAGTAKNLSADELDGKNSSAFFSGKIYEKEYARQGQEGGQTEFILSMFCDNGDTALDVGAAGTNYEDDMLTSIPASSGS